MKRLFSLIIAVCALCNGDSSPSVDLAPQSVKGKTIVLSFDNATERKLDINGENSISEWSVDINEYQSLISKNKPLSFKFDNKNQYRIEKKEKYENSDEFADLYLIVNYTKQSHNKAQIYCEDAMYNCDVNFYYFTLTFTTPTKGTVQWRVTIDEMEFEGKDGTFVIE